MKKTKIIVTIILVLTMIYMFSGCNSLFGSSPEKRAQKYLNALVAGDMETLEDFEMPLQKATSKTLKGLSKGMINSMFNSSIDDNGMNAMGGALVAYIFSGYKFTVTGSEVEGESAKVYFDVYIDDQLSRSNEFLPMTEYNGEWYVTFSDYLNLK